MEKVELLAPAGDLERAKFAIMYGADAVYIGGKKFSLRSRASNFEIEDVKEAVEFAKSYNAKIFVTVNIIPHNDDLEGLEEYLKTLEEIGVSAIICASLYIAKVSKKVAPKMEVHLSTQFSATNHLVIDFFKSLGIDRVVLARELDLNSLDEVLKKSVLPIEVFIHGGMCVNYSGKCTLSNAMTLRDANRGGCAQSCRWKYHLYDGKEELSVPDCLFSMSSKDLCAADYIEKLIKMNVASLKIEGRMKSAYYVATIIKTYRNIIDEVYASTLTADKLQEYKLEFSKAENRPAATGFLDHLPNSFDHLYGVNGAGVTQEFIAQVLDFDEEKMLAYIEVRNFFYKDDLIEVFGPNTHNLRTKVDVIISEEQEILTGCNNPMRRVYLKLPFKVYKDDLIRKVK